MQTATHDGEAPHDAHENHEAPQAAREPGGPGGETPEAEATPETQEPGEPAAEQSHEAEPAEDQPPEEDLEAEVPQDEAKDDGDAPKLKRNKGAASKKKRDRKAKKEEEPEAPPKGVPELAEAVFAEVTRLKRKAAYVILEGDMLRVQDKKKTLLAKPVRVNPDADPVEVALALGRALVALGVPRVPVKRNRFTKSGAEAGGHQVVAVLTK